MARGLDWELVEHYRDRYTFFYNGPFSNWYSAPFAETFSVGNGDEAVLDFVNKAIPSGSPIVKLDAEIVTLRFNCAEQYMMFHKAVLFGDHQAAAYILYSQNPHDQKQMGRRVKGFDVRVWEQAAKGIVYKGAMGKFCQNVALREELLGTRGTLLVEASPVDKIWGIGLAESDPEVQDVTKWRGWNWLGEVLTAVREDIAVCEIFLGS